MKFDHYNKAFGLMVKVKVIVTLTPKWVGDVYLVMKNLNIKFNDSYVEGFLFYDRGLSSSLTLTFE